MMNKLNWKTFSSAVYDDYKFVTRTELESLGMAHLIGSKMLRAYMHGYFMDVRLYNKVSLFCLCIIKPVWFSLVSCLLILSSMKANPKIHGFPNDYDCQNAALDGEMWFWVVESVLGIS